MSIADWLFFGGAVGWVAWLIGMLVQDNAGFWTRLTWPLWLPLYCLSRSGRWARASMRALRRDLPTILRLMAGRTVAPSDKRRSASSWYPVPPPAPPPNWTDTGYAWNDPAAPREEKP